MTAALLALADSRLPAGGHAHSGGIEQAVTTGVIGDPVSLAGFLRRRLTTAGAVAAGLAAAACRAADDADPAAVLAALEAGLGDRLAIDRRLVAVADTSRLGKEDMPQNTALPDIRVEPDTFTVSVDGDVWEPEPVRDLSMAQRYFLF